MFIVITLSLSVIVSRVCHGTKGWSMDAHKVVPTVARFISDLAWHGLLCAPLLTSLELRQIQKIILLLRLKFQGWIECKNQTNMT